MMKLQTPVTLDGAPVSVSYGDKIVVLGSCFADEIGARLAAAGFSVLTNPFGTLYNPVSVGNAIARLGSGAPFGPEDVVEMGAGAGKYCSFWHHTSFARETPEAFLENANRALADASAFWKECNRVIVTLGTAWAFKVDATGETVANCLKRPAAEFTRYRLAVSQTAALLPDTLFYQHLKLYTESMHHRGHPYVGEYLDEQTGAWLWGDAERSRYYNHSTYNDLIISGLVGLRPSLDN